MSDMPETPRDALETRLARLQQELPPPRDLWPEIEARLVGRRVQWRLGLGLAAGIAAVAILALIGLQLSRPAPHAVTADAGTGTSAGSIPGTGTGAVPNPGAVIATSAPDTAARAARDAAYLRTQAAVEQSFEQELAHLPKATQVRLRQDLDIIRNARADIRRALDAAPENPLLQQLFADTWQQEMDFYSSIVATNNPAGVRWPM
jgi:hypothetical protein